MFSTVLMNAAFRSPSFFDFSQASVPPMSAMILNNFFLLSTARAVSIRQLPPGSFPASASSRRSVLPDDFLPDRDISSQRAMIRDSHASISLGDSPSRKSCHAPSGIFFQPPSRRSERVHPAVSRNDM